MLKYNHSSQDNQPATISITAPASWLLILFISYTNVAAVFFTPAIPSIMRDMASSSQMISVTVAIFLLGYAFGQLLYGPINNKYGRKTALMLGFSLALIGEIICLIACYQQTMMLLLLGRFITATGACAGYAMTFAIVHDCYPPDLARKKLAVILLAFALAPGIAIILGGLLSTSLGWQSCFYGLLGYGVILLSLLKFVPETSTSLDTRPIELRRITHQYLQAIKNKRLVFYGLACSVWSAFLYTYYSHAPLIAENDFHYSAKKYGIVSFITALGYISGSIISLILVKKWQAERVIHLGLSFKFIGIGLISLVSLGWLHWHYLYFFAVAICFSGGAIFFSNAIVLGLQQVKNIAIASTLFGTLNLLGAIVCTSLLSLIKHLHMTEFLIIYLSLLILILSFNFFAEQTTGYN